MTPELLLRLMQHSVAYASCIDDGDLDDWPGFFSEDCQYKVTSLDNHTRGLEAGVIWADSRAMLKDRVAALREANIFEKQAYRHMLGLPLIQDQRDDEVRSETPFVVVRITAGLHSAVFATGRYLDLHRVTDDYIEIAERVVVCDSSSFDTLLAIPL